MKKIIAAVLLLILVAGGWIFAFERESATVPIEQGYGASPALPAPNPTLIPTVNVAEAAGWPDGATPKAADGLKVQAFAKDLDHPRWIHVLPNGDVLIAESNRPPKGEDAGSSIRGWFEGLLMRQAGAEVKSANRITLLRDADSDGVAEMRAAFLKGLNSPFGMAYSNGILYVANTDAVMAFPYKDGETEITTPGRKIADLPAGPINQHWTKDVIVSPDGTKLYATVGSNSNVGENGMDVEGNRASILEIDLASKAVRVFAGGLRNPNGLAWQPRTGALWVAVNERDELGSDLVPDYMTAVKDGGFYGWPYSYFGQHVDSRVKPQNPDLVAKAIVPDYALGPHTASLGLTFNTSNLFGPDYVGGAFVGQHGSWNRKPRSGYKVIFVPFADGKPSGPPRDILTAFVGSDDKGFGRPVGVAIDIKGALLVADDVGNTIWRVSPASAQ
ncbi:PQQ-dependent sugar dehydrogenase [Rhizobium sullae]|uniref:Glucose/arabinose dehydrogenase n=1 Tax=Rhizobium sullae TaxID=50338 RepID=A0A4V2VAB8_RHISU|nr:sorbosone dehydrogenase family protein [Rhizobium sullae]TCU20345.1 glucose/arabinose dehydrogenase [Rhizobium sullae]